MAAKKTQASLDMFPLMCFIGVVGMCVGTWYGLPGVAILLLALVVGAFLRPYPELSGKDPRTKQPVPMGQTETSKLRKFRFAERLKFRLLIPVELLTPGWPVQWSWIAGVLTGVVVWDLVPVPGAVQWYSLINGVCAAALVVVLMSARRQTVSVHEVSPGGTLDALVPLLTKRTLFMAVTGLLGAVAGAVVSYAVAVGVYVIWWSPANLGFFSPLLGAALGVVLAWAKPVTDYSLQQWRASEAARAEWIPRWELYCGTKTPPRHVNRRMVGSAIVDLFEDNSGIGAPHYISSVEKIKNLCDPAYALFILEAPLVDGDGQPQPGTIHPNRFETIQYPADDLPNITIQATPLETVELWLRCAMSATAVRTRIGRLMLESVELISPEPIDPSEDATVDTDIGQEARIPRSRPSRHVDAEVSLDTVPDTDDESAEAGRTRAAGRFASLATKVWAKIAPLLETVERRAPSDSAGDVPAVYCTVWNDEIYGPPLLDFRRTYNGDFQTELGAGSLVNHAENTIFVGDLANLSTRFDAQQRQNFKSSVSIMDLVDEDQWNVIWGALDKNKANPPKFQPGVGGSAQSGGVTIKAQSFLTLRGIDPRSYFGQEPSLATAMDQKPFVCITGYIDVGAHRLGERNPQGLSVYYSDSPVLSNPEDLRPTMRGNGDLWVLTGRMNSAFKDAKLPPPQVYKVEAITDRRSATDHVWKIYVRLYDGVTVQMLRTKLDAMRGSFGARWLQVDEQADDGCIIVVGTTPDRAAFAEGVAGAKAKAYMTALEWVNIFYKAEVTRNGLTPRLESVGQLKKNPQVAVLEFSMPGGMEFADVREKSKRLASTSLNHYVDVRTSSEPGWFKMLVSRENPMPTSTGFDFAVFDENPGRIPFATGVEGEPEFFDPTVSPHALLAGVTGAGKAEPLSSFIPTPKGWSSVGDLRVGDEVFDRRGQVVTINGFSPVTMEEAFTVRFDDGQSISTSGNHLWRVRRQQVPLGTTANSTHIDPSRNQSELVRSLVRASLRPGTLIGSLETISRLTGAPYELLAMIAGEDLALMTGVYPVAEVALLAAEHCAWSERMGLNPLNVTPEVSIVSSKNLAQLLTKGPVFVEPLAVVQGGVRGVNAHSAGVNAAVSGEALSAPWLRIDHRDRLTLLAGIMSGGESVVAEKSADLVLESQAVAVQATELVRTLGGWAHEPTLVNVEGRRRWLLRFTLPLLGAGHSARGARIVEVEAGGPPVPMRCLMVDSLDHTYLTGRFTPTHNSVLAQAFLYGFAVGGADLYIIDPMKGGADFKFVEPYAKAFADDIYKGAGLMKHIYAEVMRRKNLNAAHGVSGISELPEDIRPPTLVVMIDEFTSLTAPSTVPPKTDDVELERDREHVIAENLARGQIGSTAGKLAREARSAGVVLLLGTQKMTAGMLDKIPNGSDLKTNLARVLLGAASQPERMSAFRNPEQAAVLGPEVPKGRGIWESLTDPGIMIQVWFSPQSALSAALAERRPPLEPSQKVDMSHWMSPHEREQRDIMAAAERKVVEIFGDEGDLVLDLGSLTMEDISLEVDDPEPEPDPYEGFFDGTFGQNPATPGAISMPIVAPVADTSMPLTNVAPISTDDNSTDNSSGDDDGWGMDDTDPAPSDGEDIFSESDFTSAIVTAEPTQSVPAAADDRDPDLHVAPSFADDEYFGPDAADYDVAGPANETSIETPAIIIFTDTPWRVDELVLTKSEVVDVSAAVPTEEEFWPQLSAALAWDKAHGEGTATFILMGTDVDEENEVLGLGVTNRELAVEALSYRSGTVKFLGCGPELESTSAPHAAVANGRRDTVVTDAPPQAASHGRRYPVKSDDHFEEF